MSNIPLISTHLTPPWDEQDEALPSWEISVDFTFADDEEETVHNECFTVTCVRHEIDDAVRDELCSMYPNRQINIGLINYE